MFPGWAQPIEVGGFFISYVAAWLLEVGRGAIRKNFAIIAPFGWAMIGASFHAVHLLHRATESAGLPLSSTQDWFLVSAWVMAGVYLYFAWHHPKASFGWIILPIVLGLLTIAWVFGDHRSFPRELGGRIWAWVHGLSFLLATVAVLVAFATGVMYLVQTKRLREKKLSPTWQLPSLEWLHKTNGRTVTLALFLIAIGILSGFVLNLWNLRENRELVPLWDPLIIITLVMFLWLSGCVMMARIYRPAREGRKMAIMTIMTALFLTMALLVFVRGDTGHGQFRRPNVQNDPSGYLMVPESGIAPEKQSLFPSSICDVFRVVRMNRAAALPPSWEGSDYE